MGRDSLTSRKQVFVFGSNKAGRHGRGSANHALRHHGAIYGVGVGPQGNSYAIPTKSARFESLPLSEIYGYVKDFITYAENNPDCDFNVVAIGCGLAGYEYHDVAWMFKNIPQNVKLPEEFRKVLDDFD